MVPEVFSHLAGFYVTLLLAQGHVVAATGMFAVKLLCTLLLVWIYTTCQNTLLAVPWFAVCETLCSLRTTPVGSTVSLLVVSSL